MKVQVRIERHHQPIGVRRQHVGTLHHGVEIDEVRDIDLLFTHDVIERNEIELREIKSPAIGKARTFAEDQPRPIRQRASARPFAERNHRPTSSMTSAESLPKFRKLLQERSGKHADKEYGCQHKKNCPRDLEVENPKPARSSNSNEWECVHSNRAF